MNEFSQGDLDNSKNILNIEHKSAGMNNTESLKLSYKRIRGIVTAIYMVTNFLPENDPLRKSLRGQALKLLSFINLSIFSSQASIRDVVQNIYSCSNEIVSLLEIAFYSGYISEMNYQILRREMDAYTDESGLFYKTVKNNPSLPDHLKDIFRDQQGNQSGVDIKDKIDKYKGQKKSLAKQVVGLSSSGLKDNIKTLPSLNKSSPVYAKKQSRKDQIISVLQKKGEITIKDISSNIVDCSEKTIQRELISMVKSGILKRNGERRWSTYLLA